MFFTYRTSLTCSTGSDTHTQYTHPSHSTFLCSHVPLPPSLPIPLHLIPLRPLSTPSSPSIHSLLALYPLPPRPLLTHSLSSFRFFSCLSFTFSASPGYSFVPLPPSLLIAHSLLSLLPRFSLTLSTPIPFPSSTHSLSFLPLSPPTLF